MHDSAVASVSRRVLQRSRTISAIERSSSLKRYRPEPFSQKAGDFGSALVRSWLHDQIDVDLELAGADRHLDAVTVAACVCERLRDSGLGRPEEAEDDPPA